MLPALLSAAALAAALLTAGCAGRDARHGAEAGAVDLETARPGIDLQRFMGRWHVAAHVPWFAERGHVASSDTYALAADGRIEVRYRWREGFGEPEQVHDSVARIEPGTGNRIWKQRLFKVLSSRTRILEVAPDYSWALLDHPDRELAWILTRDPVIDAPTYRELEKKIAAHGVNTDRLRRVPQVAAQVGMLGFAVPSHP